VEILRRATLDEVLLDVAYAEVASVRWHDYYAAALGNRARALALLPLTDWNESDKANARKAARQVRGGPLQPILDASAVLALCRFRVADLSEVRLMTLDQFSRFAPTGLLHDFVANLDAGMEMVGDGFAEAYRAVRPTFDATKIRGRPILISERIEGPFVEAEGLTRMCCLLSKREAGEEVPESVEVFVGVVNDLRRSWLYRTPR
jgi:hypothetical protein